MNKLYLKLAWSNLKNSRQFYLPYVIAGMLSAMMFYTMCAIQGNEGLSKMRGGTSVQMVLFFGVIVVGVFVSIFLFYTNSFIMKRRKKELGIYNILGMEKIHIAKIMAWETFFSFLIAAGGGLILGIVFQKLLTMFLYRLTGLDASNSVLHFRMGMPSYRRTFWCHLCMYSSLQSDADPAFKSGGIAA